MEKIRFIHMADVHLGSILNIGGSSLPEELRVYEREGVYNAFRRIIKIAIKENVDFIVIAGDLFEDGLGSVKDQDFFRGECLKLERAGINVYIIGGNHDPIGGRGNRLFSLPENVKVFGFENVESVDFKGKDDRTLARIYGQSYRTRSLNKKIHLNYRLIDGRDREDIWNIALLHSQLESGDSNYVPASLRELKSLEGFHYWALGHIHDARILSHDYPMVVYPGVVQGRDIGERGPGGCFLIELEAHRPPRHNFIASSFVSYERIQVKLDDISIETLDDILDHILNLAEELVKRDGEIIKDDLHLYEDDHRIEGHVVEWVLEGATSFYENLMDDLDESLDYIKNALNERLAYDRPFLWTRGLRSRLRPRINFEEIFSKSPVYEAINRALLSLDQEDELKEDLIKELGDYFKFEVDHEDEEDLHFYLASDSLKEILEEARERIFYSMYLEGIRDED